MAEEPLGPNGEAGHSDGPALTSTGRTIQACDRCRFKKVRCDGTVPACGRCKAAGLECLTTVKLNRKAYPRSYTESIEERLRQLEAEVHKLRAGNDSKDRRIKELEAANANMPSPRQTGGSSSASSSRHESGVPKLGAKAPMDEPLSREVGRMNLDRRGIGRFMGSSSGIFFIGTAEQRFASILGQPGNKIGDALLRVDVDEQTTDYTVYHGVDVPTTMAPLPPRETAERYIDVWFDAWRHVFPILHRPSFADSVNRLYSTPASEHERPVLGMFYLVLAISCRYCCLTGEVDGQPTVKSNLEDIEYYSQSSKYHNDVMAANNLATMQYQELLTLWFLYTGKRSFAFQMTGSMTRLALELGLHRHTRRFHFDPLQTELRKRVFWVCYMLDNFVSAIHGLPKSFRDQDIDVELPSDVDDDFVNSSGYLLSLPGEPTGMLTFVSLIKVVRVLSNTLEILYTTTDRRQTVTKIKTIDKLLDQWINTLPDHLQLDPNALTRPPLRSTSDTLIELSTAFLHLAYLYTRFSAHRVALSFFPSEPQYRISLVKCMEFSKELIFLNSRFRRHLIAADVNPGTHVYTLWSCGLVSLFGLHEFRNGKRIELSTKEEDDAKTSASTCIEALDDLVAAGRVGEKVRADNLRTISAAISENRQIPENTSQADRREAWYQRPPPPSIPPQQQKQHNMDIAQPPSTQQQPSLPAPPTPQPQFPQFLQQLYAQPSPATLPPSDPQLQQQQQPELQSPGLSRLNMSATSPSPSFINNFNIDFSSPFAHPYDRLSDTFTTPSASDNNSSSSQQITATATGLTSTSTHPHQHQPHHHQQLHPGHHQHHHQPPHPARQVWDDPVFNITSMMHVPEPGHGSSNNSNSNNSSSAFPMQDMAGTDPIGMAIGGGGGGGGVREGIEGGVRKRARVDSSGG
ncbi:hypothetical protein AJ79_07287 [Helicocarpus griseus UAMH5409]|uniref:Zn(2)-C6 fungal-type domain-containing protein n=1 Tax=Helicocarpus griseus UAMH5409 TaxID=1447875 RepID=A0A2B7X426_9EURO|nr:hypothetical protein AJ79_07287 [Helicocarpus griseus UAMH5409]